MTPPEGSAARRLTGDVAVYGLATLLAQSVVLIVTPVLARSLGPDGYGIVDVLTALVGLAAIVFSLGVDVATLRLYYEEDDRDGARQVMSTGLVFVAALTGVGAIVGVAASADDRLLSPLPSPPPPPLLLAAYAAAALAAACTPSTSPAATTPAASATAAGSNDP